MQDSPGRNVSCWPQGELADRNRGRVVVEHAEIRARDRDWARNQGLAGHARVRVCGVAPRWHVVSAPLRRAGVRVRECKPSQSNGSSTIPSSIAMTAPWPRNGSIGWAASPSMETRPIVHCCNGSRSRKPHLNSASVGSTRSAARRVDESRSRARIIQKSRPGLPTLRLPSAAGGRCRRH